MSASADKPDDKVWTVLDLLRWTTTHFEECGLGTPRLDAECLLAHALGCDRLRLYVDFDKPVQAEERARFRELVLRRARERVPVALLTGMREFWSMPLKVTSDTLVPRPETETLVAVALARIPEDQELRVLDLGTGSGAVALAIAKERPKAHVTATDVSAAALAVAQENAERLDLAERVELLEGDLFAPVADRSFDVIVSNPPYVSEQDERKLAPELRHEPRGALFAAEDGLACLRAITAGAPAHLSPGGFMAVELAPQQSGPVGLACRAAGLEDVEEHVDLEGRPRVISARAPGRE